MKTFQLLISHSGSKYKYKLNDISYKFLKDIKTKVKLGLKVMLLEEMSGNYKRMKLTS